MGVDLTTKYLGLTLRSPLLVAACPLTAQLHALQRLEAACAGAVVLPSLFQEQIEHEEPHLQNADPSGHDMVHETPFVPQLTEYNSGLNSYLRHVSAAKRALSIPVIGSLNGRSPGDWVRFARLIEEAGADALELNIYFMPTDPQDSASEVEDRHVHLVRLVRSMTTLPLAVKISPFFTSLANLADRLIEAGADGLVLFNRFLQPDIDLATLEVRPNLVLSSRDELRLPLRWTSILRRQLTASLAATSGIHFAEDVLKMLLAGADVTMVASCLLRHGPEYLRTLHNEVTHWLDQHGYRDLSQLRGSLSYGRRAHPAAMERAHYMQAVATYSDPPSGR